MPIYNKQIPPPANWQDFEKLCLSLWEELLSDPHIQYNGHLGQMQNGVDILGHSKDGKLTGIQCKCKDLNTNNKLTVRELKAEVEKAKSFKPTLDVFILATTTKNDNNLQSVAEEITIDHRKNGLFSVHIFFWDSICHNLESSPNTLKKFYPELVNNHELQDFKKWISNQLPPNQANGGKDNSNNQASLEEIKKAFKVQSSFLSKWPQTLSINKKWLERKEEDEWLSKIHSASYSTTILLGEQGTGKSALLARITNKLHAQGIPVLGIKADKLSHSVTDFQSLSAFLKLPGNIISCIKKIAEYEPVFLLIDQMDALSDLVDVKTNRLSVLLDLINNLHHIANIHILASSRPFELKYDSRFNTIEADTIELSLLSWDAVKETLDELNIKFTFIDNDFKNFIRRPNNLNLFLSHIKNYPEQKFKSHIDLYELIWNYSLGSGSERKARSELLIKLATEMTEEAKLALPAINFEDYMNEIDFLCQTGLLVKNNKQISFAHQTLQAFVWTRSLLKNGSLVKFVLTHQNNLNIRPKLFTAILYLREADPWEYNNQLNLLLSENRTHLRTHILFLLIETIGSFIDPSDHEFCVFSDLLRDRELTSKICLSIAGSKGWFNKFKETHVTYLMNGSVSQQKGASIILASAIRFSPEIVLDFLIKYWKNEEQLYYLFHVLQNNTYWNEKAIDLAEYIITSKDIGNFPAQELAQRISKTNPESAVNLAAQFFIKKLEFLELSPISGEIENPEDNDIDEWLLEQKRRKPFEDFAEVNTTWQHLNILAKLTPKIFVSAFWPLLNKLSYHLKVQYSESRFEYRNVSGTWFYLNGDSGHMRNYLVSSMETGIKLFAKQYQNNFLSFLNKAKKSSFTPQHRLLTIALNELCPHHSSTVLNYFMEDDRRFFVGNSQNVVPFKDSTNLISTLFPYLDSHQRSSLEQKIWSLCYYDTTSIPNPKDRKRFSEYNRHHRQRLISSIPLKLLSLSSKKKLREEERKFGKIEKENFSTDSHSVNMAPENPLPLDKIKKTEINNIVRLIVSIDQSDSWEVIKLDSLSRTLAEYSKIEPDKVIEVIKQLSPDNTKTISQVLEALPTEKINLIQIQDLILFFTAKEIKAPDFFQSCARALDCRIKEDEGLSDEWCSRLETWLSQSDNKPIIVSPSCNHRNHQSSLLWNSEQSRPIPHKDYFFLKTLRNGLLLRKNPDCKKWLNLLSHHIEDNHDLEYWTFVLQLLVRPTLGHCNIDNLNEFLLKLCNKHPEILVNGDFGITLAQAIHHMPQEMNNRWLYKIKEYKTPQSNQLFGELIGFRLIIDNEPVWSLTEYRKILHSKNSQQLIGLAWSFSQMWEFPKFRSKCLQYINEILNLQQIETDEVLIRILFPHQQIDAGPEYEAVLNAFINNKTLTRTEECSSVPHSLLKIIQVFPEKVFQLSSQIINREGKRIGDFTTSAAADAPDLVTIALTLHNMGHSYQQKGMELFENLLKFDALKTRDALLEIDARPRFCNN